METIIFNKLVSSPANILVSGVAGSFSNSFSNSFNVAVAGRIYNCQGTVDVPLPVIEYTITGSTPVMSLGGETDTTEYECEVKVIAVLAKNASDIGSAVRTGLRNWRDDNVKVCYLTNSVQSIEDDGFQTVLSFKLIGV